MLRATPLAWAAAVLCAPAASAWAQSATDPATPAIPADLPTQLKTTPSLTPPLGKKGAAAKLSREDEKKLPIVVQGQSISGRPDLETVVDGQAELKRGDTSVQADRIEYYQPDDLVKARGNVRLERDGNIYQGSEAQIKVDAQEGYINEPRYELKRLGAHGQASRIDFLDSNRAVARNANYTTCRREPEGASGAKPDWEIRAAQIRVDQDSDIGQASDSRLIFKGVPVLGVPELSFPLSDARKSGWLPPSINIDNVSGLETVVPYYLNLAPNRDATIYPGVMVRRGLNIGGEFRYLEDSYRGTARLDLMPNDRLRKRGRWGWASNHSGTVDTDLGKLNTSLTLNRVSDDDYWRDFPRATSSLTQRLLPNDANLSWSEGSWSLSSRALKWQTLQQIDSALTPPYNRMPQLNGRYSRVNHNGLDYSLELDTTRFEADASLTLQPNAQRSYALAQISYPLNTAGSYFIPKLQLHSSSYSLSQNPAGSTYTSASLQRSLPTLSLDSGLIFERSASYFGRQFTQTLEPRAFYTYTPYRDQSNIPIYDSGTNDFNFATIYSENAFTGHDRISDNNLLTLGVTSRLINPQLGMESLRLSYAQRLRLQDQRVTLPGGSPDTARLSDMLFGAGINWDPQWSFDTTAQYNPKTRRSQRSTISGRYSPSNYRVISSTYRFNRGISEQVDVGWQWPLNDLWGDRGKDLGAGQGQGEGRWYSVGRVNYSMRDNRLVDTIVGLEYDAGCWLARAVVERLQTTSNSATKRILLQLEFVGFARVGSNPLTALKNNVPRYQLLREKISN